MTIDLLILSQERREYKSFEKELDEVDWQHVSRCLSVLQLPEVVFLCVQLKGSCRTIVG